MNATFIGKKTSIRIHYILGFVQILKLVIKLIILVETKQLECINKILCKWLFIVSELDKVLQSDCYQSPLGYDNVDWFVDDFIKLENGFYFKNTIKDINMTQEGEKFQRIKNICRFCEKGVFSDKVRDHCHLTGKHRGPAHIICKIIVTQKQINFIPFTFHNFSKYDCHLFFKRLFDNDKL